MTSWLPTSLIALSLIGSPSSETQPCTDFEGQATFWFFASQIETVFTIAHSVSNSVTARWARSQYEWEDVEDPDEADAVLVVVATFALRYPLDSTYDSIDELSDDADSQMNITGELFHLYIYVPEGSRYDERAHMRCRDVSDF